jgi:hypothetical protein
MWMRTIMNYQYRYGTSTTEAAKKLYKEGGVGRSVTMRLLLQFAMF